MTLVSFTPPGIGGTAKGYIEGRPVGTGLLPDGFRARLVGGTVSVELTPSTATWAWNIIERCDYGRDEYVQVNAAGGVVDYETLVRVDPETLDPTTPVSPAWGALVTAEATARSNADATLAAADATLTAAKVDKPTLPNVAPIVYGNSVADERNGGVVPTIVSSAANMWPNRVATALGLPTPLNYAVGGTKSIETLFGLISSSAAPGLVAPRSGSVWSSATANAGRLVFFEDLGNDISHFVDAATPVAITGAAGDRYLAAMQNIRETQYAIVSSDNVIQVQAGQSGVTFSTGWLNTNLDVAYAKGGKVAYGWNNGEYVDIVIPASKIAQTGPLAGKVFVGLLQYDPGTFANAVVQASVDGTLVKSWTPVAWEVNGSATTSYGGFMVDLPTDGAQHILRVLNNGLSGTDLLTINAVYCMSANPPEVFVKDGAGVKVGTYCPTPADVATWNANRNLIQPRVLAAVEQFPNVHWVETHVPPGDLAVDGIHPKDEGMYRHMLAVVDVIKGVFTQRQTGRVAHKQRFDRKADLGADGTLLPSQVPANLPIKGSLTHTGSTLGFYGVTPVTRPAANPNTSGATLTQLETEVNELKALLRSIGLLT